MKKIQFLFIVLICVGLLPASVFSQTDVQKKFNRLFVGQTNLEQIEEILGDTTSNGRITDWWGRYLRSGVFLASVNSHEYDVNRDSIAGLTKRTLYKLEYDNFGLELKVLDNPWQLYSIKTTNPEITIKDIKIGDPLSKVEAAFGKPSWATAEDSDSWWNIYEKKGLSFEFLRDKSVRKSPRRLVENPTVVSIELSDSKVSFVRF